MRGIDEISSLEGASSELTEVGIKLTPNRGINKISFKLN
jgi:hypothetical protein